ncbi:hypothetical protein AZH51_10670 [Branchiibius sp. NY16-3462-2]|nr:hypothetical protein AZH51_10670 [Branchiibius sp. NY16-3462-2]
MFDAVQWRMAAQCRMEVQPGDPLGPPATKPAQMHGREIWAIQRKPVMDRRGHVSGDCRARVLSQEGVHQLPMPVLLVRDASHQVPAATQLGPRAFGHQALQIPFAHAAQLRLLSRDHVHPVSVAESRSLRRRPPTSVDNRRAIS